jgi:transcription elongation factor Elf1
MNPSVYNLAEGQSVVIWCKKHQKYSVEFTCHKCQLESELTVNQDWLDTLQSYMNVYCEKCEGNF